MNLIFFYQYKKVSQIPDLLRSHLSEHHKAADGLWHQNKNATYNTHSSLLQSWKHTAIFPPSKPKSPQRGKPHTRPKAFKARFSGPTFRIAHRWQPAVSMDHIQFPALSKGALRYSGTVSSQRSAKEPWGTQALSVPSAQQRSLEVLRHCQFPALSKGALRYSGTISSHLAGPLSFPAATV